jgi:hypothetical protein
MLQTMAQLVVLHWRSTIWQHFQVNNRHYQGYQMGWSLSALFPKQNTHSILGSSLPA